MIYEETPYNLTEIIRELGYVHKDQIMKFFSDANDAFSVPYYLKELIDAKMVDYDEVLNILKWHNQPKENPDLIKAKVRAFWIVSAFKSADIREVRALNYPQQILFITAENDAYDITVCNSETEAQLGMQAIKAHAIAGVDDEVNHIAVVRTEEAGKKLAPYKYDSYCVLDRSFTPRYFTWG